ncbi:MAG: divergent polysaccharide deacetylase family protein [Rhodospirillaceae bacterium]|nr:divergent polysaccharide deacetylase family protein [Rhodospirillaceae bacterium]
MALSLPPIVEKLKAAATQGAAKAWAPVAALAAKVRGRDQQPRDPFSGEDLFDGEPRESNMGPKIALATSGVLLIALVGLVATVMMSGGEAPQPVLGSLAELQVEEEPSAEAAAATAATDRSPERRPWLTGSTETSGGERLLGVDSAAPKPAAPVMTPPPAPAPVVAEAAPLPKAEPKPDPKSGAKPAAAPQSTSDLLAMVKAGAEPAAPAPPAISETTTSEPAKSEPAKTGREKSEPAQADVVASVAAPAGPTLAPPGVAPGAPVRFDLPDDPDTAPTTVGGRPRLSEPRMPPTDRAAVTAPPPRFAALSTVVSDAAPTAGAAAKVAVIVEGLGLNQAATEAAIQKLPSSVTLSFSPYARNLKSWLQKAKADGHDVLIEVPMESKAFPAEDPGPLGLLTQLDAADNAQRLKAILDAAEGAVGVYDPTGSKFRESEPHIDPVFATLKERNLFYVQGRPGVRVGEPEVPTATADVVVDERPFRAALDARFDYAETLAKYQGSAVAVVSAKPVSFERLALWVEQLPKKGVALAPVSQILIR